MTDPGDTSQLTAEQRSRVLVDRQLTAAGYDTGLPPEVRLRALVLRRAFLEAAFSGRLTGWNSDTMVVDESVGAAS